MNSLIKKSPIGVSIIFSLIAISFFLSNGGGGAESGKPTFAFNEIPSWHPIHEQLLNDYLGGESFHLASLLLFAANVSYFTDGGDAGIRKDSCFPYIMAMQQILKDPENSIRGHAAMYDLVNLQVANLRQALLRANPSGEEPNTGLKIEDIVNVERKGRLLYGDQLLGALEKTIERKNINFESLRGKPTYWLRLQIEDSLTEAERGMIKSQVSGFSFGRPKIGLDTKFVLDAYRAGEFDDLEDAPFFGLDEYRSELELIKADPEGARRLGLIQEEDSEEIDPETESAIALLSGVGTLAFKIAGSIFDTFKESATSSGSSGSGGSCSLCGGRGRIKCDGDGYGKIENCLMCQGSGWRICIRCGGAGW